MTDITLRDYATEIDGMIENRSYDAAIAHCKYILNHYPKYIEAYRLLGKASLEKEDDETTLDIFQRVLSVDPEDFVARVGLSIVYDRHNALDRAIWHMERAFDLRPSNAVIQTELKRLYGRRDGAEPERISLTRSALARMYAQGDLYPEAIADLRKLLQEQPDRIDLQLLLTQVLWRDDQRIPAVEWAQKVLERLPYCLTANLILGEIWRSSGQDGDSDLPLKRAQAVDPDNTQATEILGSASPLPGQTVTIPRMGQATYEQLMVGTSPEAEADEVPDWLRGLADLSAPAIEAPEVAGAPRLPTDLHMPETGPLRTDIPEWLQGLTTPTESPSTATGPEAEVPSWFASLEAPIEAPAVEMPDWLSQLSTLAPAEPEVAQPTAEEEVPDWIRQLGAGVADQSSAAAEPAVEVPDWLASLQSPPIAAEPTTVAEQPDWLRELQSMEPSEPSEPQVAEHKIEIDSDRTTITRLVEAFGTAEQEPAASAEALAEPTVEIPEEVPSPDDALAFLARLSAGKEDQLRTQAEHEAALRMDEIMGRKPHVAAPVPEAEEMAQPTPVSEMPDWLRGAQPEAAEVQPEIEEVAAAVPETVETAADFEAEMDLWPMPIAEEEAQLAELAQPQPEAAPVETAAIAEDETEPAAEPVPSVTLPVEWWVQSAEDEGEEPLQELPPPFVPAAPIAPMAPRAKRERATARAVVPPLPPAPAPTVVSVDVEPLLARLRSDSNDQEARLELARTWWSSGNRDQALSEYNTLVSAGAHTEEVMGDLERITEIDERPHGFRLLGDLYMKLGRLPRALEAYRRALNQL